MSKEAMKLALKALGNTWTEPGNKQYEIEKEAITALREALAEQPAQPQQEPVAYFETITGRIAVRDDTHRRKFPMCYRPLVFGDTSPPAQRKPLNIGKEAAAFKTWFDAWWVGDGELCKAVTTEVEQSNSYKSLYTLAFGAWMAAKEAAYGTKRDA